jgi:putative endonuclease
MIIVYVLESTDARKRYVGITNDLERRLKEHQSKATKGGQLLGTFIVLHVEKCVNHSEARKREKFLKSGQGREWLLEKYPRDKVG